LSLWDHHRGIGRSCVAQEEGFGLPLRLPLLQDQGNDLMHFRLVKEETSCVLSNVLAFLEGKGKRLTQGSE
jgi:hypothetical protein